MNFPAIDFWQIKAPPKACYFTWAPLKDKIPPGDACKRSFFIASRFSLCLKEEESVKIIFFSLARIFKLVWVELG